MFLLLRPGVRGVATGLVAAKFLRRLALITPAVLALASTFAADGEMITPEERSRGFRSRTLLAKPRALLDDIEQAESNERLRLVRAHARLGGLRILETDGRGDVKTAIDRLAATGLYEYVEPDYIRYVDATPNDPRFGADQWSLANTGQSGGTAGADIAAGAAWDIQREAPDVIVAVMDTGLLVVHEDIAANVWVNPAERSGLTGADDDANGYLDDHNGINATVVKTSASATTLTDENGHGTHVAGIIAAVGDNGKGVAGVAWKTQIMPLKFIGRNGGAVSAAVACIDYAIAKGAHIINGSYGSLQFSQAEYDAIKRARDAGIIFVAAAGNDSQEINETPHYPAAYALDNIVAVASTTRQDKLASYSTFGSGVIELAAPGSSILSLGIETTTSYATLSGTSMAAPHVSGALALLKQKFPADNHRALINRLLSSVDTLPALENRVHTNGRLNLLRALTTSDTRPFNDDFARRAVLNGSMNIARSSTQFATQEPGEPVHGSVPGTTGTLWWKWTPPAGVGKVTISTNGSAIDSVVAVYRTATSPALETLQPIAANDDAAEGTTTSSVTFDPIAGESYAIAVAGKGTAAGLVVLNILAVPVNDRFAAARVLVGSSVVIEGNNANATAEPGEPKARSASGATIGNSKTIWYRWVAPETRTFQISVDGRTTDPVTAIYTGNALDTLAQVGFDDDSGPGRDSLVRINAIAGVTYHICVDSFAASGSFTLSIADAAWQYVADDDFYASPALAADGTLYLADSFGYVHAVNPNGTRKWRALTVTGFVNGGSLAVAPDGTLYVGDDLGYVYALDPSNGARKWRYETNDKIWAAPAIASDGTVYIKSDDDQLYALNADGTLKWKVTVPGDTYAAPAVAADGTIYIGAGKESALFAVNPDGTLKWRANVGATIYASPAIGSDGTIYIGNYDGRCLAFRGDGSERWRFDSGSPLSTSPVLDSRGLVYFGSYDKKLYALDAATGAKRWEYTTGDIIRSTSPVIADDGTIYIGSDDCFVHALNPNGTLRRTYATTGPILAAPLLSAGRLYVASLDAKLYAFDTGNNLARAPWPMHRHNVRRLARAAELGGIPVISTQPVAPANTTAGSPVAITSAATLAGAGTIQYQWYFNDSVITGATAATLRIASAQGSDAGSYRVLISGPGGSLVSNATVLNVSAAASDAARLVNLAVRTTAGSGDRVLFVGFAVGGLGTSGDKALLVRGVGPTLAGFGVTGTLADPKVQIFSGTHLLLENDDWAGDSQVAVITPQVGAFALEGTASKDAAFVTTRLAGSYTAQVSGAGATPGVVLAEIYDATPNTAFTASTPRLINVSARTQVGTGGNVLIAGFVIDGRSSRTVMVRAIGPTLGLFGVPNTLVDPKLELYQTGAPVAISTNDNWGAATNATQVAAAAAAVGAFPLALESRDAVLLVTLPAGSYTAQVSGVNNSTGAALVEVYEVP